MTLKNLSSDKPVCGQYLIIENQLRIAKNGSSYLAMKIGDRTGELAVKIWDADDELFQRLEVGKVIAIDNILPKTYKEQIQLELDGKSKDTYKVIPDSEVDYALFLPQSPGNLMSCWNYLWETIGNIQDPTLKKVLLFFFDDPDFKKTFMMVPAALKRHHAYIGGLIEHTTGVTALCKAAANYYPMINRDLLLAGAILHDIGKVKTYKVEKSFDGTNEGKLIGHLILGVKMVEQAITRVAGDGTPEAGEDIVKLSNSLLHLLVSHHGIMEWGSPIEPLMVEACILHHADNMDAQVTKFLTIMRGQPGNSEWAPFDPGLGRSIFLGHIPGTISDESREL